MTNACHGILDQIFLYFVLMGPLHFPGSLIERFDLNGGSSFRALWSDLHRLCIGRFFIKVFLFDLRNCSLPTKLFIWTSSYDMFDLLCWYDIFVRLCDLIGMTYLLVLFIMDLLLAICRWLTIDHIVLIFTTRVHSTYTSHLATPKVFFFGKVVVFPTREFYVAPTRVIYQIEYIVTLS